MSTASQFPFQPLGPTHLVIGNIAVPIPVQINVRETTTGVGQYRIINDSILTVFLGVGSTAAQATANAVAPTVGNPTAAVTLVPGAVEVLRFNNNAFVTVLSPGGAADIYITPGQGL
jgi:hypothetical protein